MTNETSMHEIIAPETFHKIEGVKDDKREWEDQAWSDLCALINDDDYSQTIYGYFPVHILWDLSSTTKYGENIYGDSIVDTGQIYGKQAAGVLIVSRTEIVLQARKGISQKFPSYPPILSKGGLFDMALSIFAQTKVIALSIYDKDLSLRIPLDDLAISVQSHVSLRDAVAIQHPEVGYLRLEGVFTGHDAEIVKMIRAAQKELQHQERQKLVQSMVKSLSSEEMAKEVAALSSLRELNPEAYEIAVQAIMKKYAGDG